MSIEHIAKLFIGKELTEDETAKAFEADEDDNIEINNISERNFEITYKMVIWHTDENKIMKINIHGLMEQFKEAVEKYGDRAELVFMMDEN